MYKKINKKQESVEVIYDVVKYISTIVFLSYILGFIAWNYFLNNYSFFEYTLLQTRYISAGLLFLLPITIFGYIIYFCINKFCKKYLSHFTFVYIILSLLVFSFIFVPCLFVKIPSKFGGAKPFVTALLADSEQIKYLSNFVKIDEAGAETLPVCNLYQNKDFIIIGIYDKDELKGRVLILKQEQIIGYNQRTRYEKGENEICKNFLEWKIDRFFSN